MRKQREESREKREEQREVGRERREDRREKAKQSSKEPRQWLQMDAHMICNRINLILNFCSAQPRFFPLVFDFAISTSNRVQNGFSGFYTKPRVSQVMTNTTIDSVLSGGTDTFRIRLTP